MWGLVLSLNFFEWLNLRISSQQSLRFGIFERIVLKISSERSLRLGHNGMSRTIILWAILIYLSKNKRRLKTINYFL